MQVGQALLVLLHDGQQGAHVPDLMVDVVPPGFGRSFGGSARDHVHCGQRWREDWGFYCCGTLNNPSAVILFQVATMMKKKKSDWP